MANTSEKHLFLGVKQVTKEQFDTFSDTVKKQYVWFVKDTDNVGETTYGVYFGNRRFANDGFTEAEIAELLSEKQDVLTAGEGIDIDSANTISCTVDLQSIIDDINTSTGTTFSSDKIIKLFREIAQFNIEIVNELPSTGDDHTIYFVPAESGGTPDDYYNEYMYIDGKWELIGNTRIDLSNYYTKTEVNDLLSSKSNTGHTHVISDVSGLTEELDSKADKVPPTPLCFTAQQANSTIGITNNGGNTPNIEISIDNGNTWTAWNYNNITLNSFGDKILMRGMNQSGFSTSSSKYSTFTMSGLVAASGNIMSLIDYTKEANTIPCDYCFYRLFLNCTSLTTAPELPATVLAYACYNSMFDGCTSLISAPELPATTLASYCYSYMFYNCSSLTTAPELPATTLATNCYNSMFYNCSSLTTAPELPATTLANWCYGYMFTGCRGLTKAPELPATTLASNCYIDMFRNCTSLTTAPELPATTLATNCYNSMFYNCSSLTTAPELPATTLASYCYSSMFNGCNNLTYIKCLAVNGISTNNTTANWVYGVANSGTFVKDSTSTGWTLNSASGIPSDWTVYDYYDDVELDKKLDTKVSSSYIKTIWKGTQTQYDNLGTYDSNTLYIIEE